MVWDQLAQGVRQVLIREAGGEAEEISTGGIASYPAVAAVGDEFVVAWTDQAEGSSVIRVLRVR